MSLYVRTVRIANGKESIVYSKSKLKFLYCAELIERALGNRREISKADFSGGENRAGVFVE